MDCQLDVLDVVEIALSGGNGKAHKQEQYLDFVVHTSLTTVMPLEQVAVEDAPPSDCHMVKMEVGKACNQIGGLIAGCAYHLMLTFSALQQFLRSCKSPVGCR